MLLSAKPTTAPEFWCRLGTSHAKTDTTRIGPIRIDTDRVRAGIRYHYRRHIEVTRAVHVEGLGGTVQLYQVDIELPDRIVREMQRELLTTGGLQRELGVLTWRSS